MAYDGKLYRIPSRYDDPKYEPKDGVENQDSKTNTTKTTKPTTTQQSINKRKESYDSHISDMEKQYSENSSDCLP